MFYQLLWNKILQSSKKTTTTNKNHLRVPTSGEKWPSQTTPTGFQPTQPTIWPVRNLSGDHLLIPAAWLEIRLVGWLLFFCKWKKWEANIRKQSNKHVTNANAIFVEKNEWIILVNYDIVHMFSFYWPPDISKHVQLIFGTMPFLR